LKISGLQIEQASPFEVISKVRSILKKYDCDIVYIIPLYDIHEYWNMAKRAQVIQNKLQDLNRQEFLTIEECEEMDEYE
jgi:hypothetical protein